LQLLEKRKYGNGKKKSQVNGRKENEKECLKESKLWETRFKEQE